jgi:hypothetical protein
MPAAFEKCVKDGGKVRTVTLPDNKYRHVCTLNGKSYYGEVKKKKENSAIPTALGGVQGEGDLTTFSAAAKTEVDKEDRTMVATLTTSDVDHGGTVILPDGISLTVYRKNPIVLWQHMSFMPPIGVNQWIKKPKNGNSLIGKTKFATRPENHEGTWMPDVVMDLYQQNVLKGVSVGLDVKKARFRGNSDEDDKFFKETKQSKDVWRVVEKANLIEYSCCSIPMNPNALKEALDDGFEIPDNIANVLGIPQAVDDPDNDIFIAEDDLARDYEVVGDITNEDGHLVVEFVDESTPEPEKPKAQMTANDVVNAAKALGASNKLAEDIVAALKVDSMVKTAIDKEFGKV